MTFLARLPRETPRRSLESRDHYYSFHLADKEIILLRNVNTPRFNHVRFFFFSHLRFASDYD